MKQRTAKLYFRPQDIIVLSDKDLKNIYKFRLSRHNSREQAVTRLAISKPVHDFVHKVRTTERENYLLTNFIDLLQVISFFL